MAEELRHLYRFAFQRRRYRQKVGGAVAPEQQAKLFERDHSNSALLVAEMNVAAGVVAANYAHKNKVPVVYRGQKASGKQLGKTEMSMRPLRHAGLGLDMYMQVTSPLRRSVDLVAHFQIKARLRKESLPFREKQIKAEIERVENTSKKIAAFDKEARRGKSGRDMRLSMAGAGVGKSGSMASCSGYSSSGNVRDFANCRKGIGLKNGIRKMRTRRESVA